MSFHLQPHDQLLKAAMQHEQVYMNFFEWALSE